MRIAVVGAGIAGLGSAWLLQRAGHQVTVFEAASHLGGHTHTVDVTFEGHSAPVDTGFLVFNDRTYPRLCALFDTLGVRSVAASMSFSCRVDAEALEWAGTNLVTLFAQPANLLRAGFHRMLGDVIRFNRSMTALVREGNVPDVTLAQFLETARYSREFRQWYLLPMSAAIWSSPIGRILDFPLPSLVRFCHNHGLLQISDRPQWRSVIGGGRAYVGKLAGALADVRVRNAVLRIVRDERGVAVSSVTRASERFDAVVLACHSDQSLALLGEPSAAERRLLSRIGYQRNRVILHTDPALLPRRKRAWSAWNYLATDDPSGARPVSVSYLINRLQPLPFKSPVIVTLNPAVDPGPRSVLGEWEFAHPLFDAGALEAQQAMRQIQGDNHTWYAGAWLGHGFHEDGFASACAVADGIAASRAHGGRERISDRIAA